MNNKKPGYLLVALLIAGAIIAVIFFLSGNFSFTLGSEKTEGTVNYQVNELEDQVNDYKKRQEDFLE